MRSLDAADDDDALLGSLGSGTYSDKGPTITVSKDTTTTTWRRCRHRY
ncbi:hypothetical protein GS461_22735 [Rhodococcus hoagii]|nr:hypothetical protein [Prescottella equi]